MSAASKAAYSSSSWACSWGLIVALRCGTVEVIGVVSFVGIRAPR
jgi:hypothetical protein